MLRVRVLGDLTIEVDESGVEPPGSRRARALLGWLAVQRRMHPRSALAARFWPDVLDESARTSLRSALSALRRSLGPDSDRYLIARRDEVGLADESLVWNDLAEFHRCVAQERLDEALELCHGELLADLDDDWVYELRDQHHDRMADVLSRLAAGAEAGADLQQAIGYTRRQVALDPLAEEPQRELMRRLAAAGDRAGAIRTYERLSRRLRDELRMAPSPATRALVESLRGGDRGGDGDAGSDRAAPAAPVPAGAVVTLLFTDLVGSTALLSQLGDDEAERLRRVHFGLLRDVAAAHGGEEVKNLGDGLMVAFSSAVHAVSCAVAIQQAVHRHNARQGDDRLKVRVGLNIGEPIRDEGDYFGTPVVVAKRLCDRADGGQNLATELLRSLIGTRGSFDFRSSGALELKGIAQPLPACEVLWAPAQEKRIALPPPFATEEPAALVGRAAELGQLRRCWQEACARRRQVAMLVGEPGIGKTRLAAEFCREAHADGAAVLLGRCYEQSLVPYGALVEALRHYVSDCPLDELRLALGPHRATLTRLLPELAGDAPQALPVAGAESPEREQFVLFDAVASVLTAIAAGQPLIVVLDDLHWADAPLVSLLRHIVRATEAAPLLVLGTYRETEVDEAHPLSQALAELRRARLLQSFSLDGLGEADVAAMICAQAGRPAPATVTRSIVDRTQGNPFFVEELLRQAVAGDDFTEALSSIPDSVKDLLLRRLRRLDDTAKRLLTFAAVSGREFDLEVLERVTGMSAERIIESLEEAILGAVVNESSSVIGRYSFAHALIREVIYEQTSLTRRAQLHRQIGEAIERAPGARDGERASALAYHFTVAGDLARAYPYHARAAATAADIYAVEPALAHYTAALEAAGALGLSPDGDATVRALLLERGRMRYRTGDLVGSRSDFEIVLDATRRAEDRCAQMEVLNELGMLELQSDCGAAARCHHAALDLARELGDKAAQTNALDRLAVISSHLLKFDRALELGEQALELARETGDETLVGRAIDSIKLAAWQLGDLARLEEITGELARLWRARTDLWYLQFTLQEAAFVPIGRASWPEASERLAEADAINRRVHDPLAQILILHARCWLHRSRGAYDDALTEGRRAVTLAPAVAWEAWAAEALGLTLLDLRAAEQAAEVLAGGVAAAQRVGRPNELVRCLGPLAWARRLLGDEDDAVALATQGEKLLGDVTAPAGGGFVFGAHSYAAIARVLLASGAAERAVILVRPVFEAAERSGWCEAAAITALVSGLCLESLGERDQARAMLGRSAELADDYGIPAPGWEAHAALARLDHSDQHAAAAAAVVEGMTATLTDAALRQRLRGQVSL